MIDQASDLFCPMCNLHFSVKVKECFWCKTDIETVEKDLKLFSFLKKFRTFRKHFKDDLGSITCGSCKHCENITTESEAWLHGWIRHKCKKTGQEDINIYCKCDCKLFELKEGCTNEYNCGTCLKYLICDSRNKYKLLGDIK